MNAINTRHLQTVEAAGLLSSSRKVSNLDDHLYHSDLHIQSCSMLKGMLDSPGHYQSALTARRTASKTMDFGTLVHLLVLEPHHLLSKVAIFPGANPTAAESREFNAGHQGMMVFDEPTFHMAENARDKLLNQMVMGRLFGDYLAEGESEASIYYTDPDTGVECRTRMDLRHPDVLFDLKTTAYAHSKQWVRHALKLHYDLQAYMYSLADCLYSGLETPRPFVFVTVENEYPLSTAARRAGVNFLTDGGRKYKHAITAYAACAKADYWPCPGGEEVIETNSWDVDFDTSWLGALPVPSVSHQTFPGEIGRNSLKLECANFGLS